MDKFLKLPSGELARLADLQRKEELKRELGDNPAPLFLEVRELILRKCNPERQEHVRAIFEKQAFGELERLVTQTLLDVVKRVAQDQLENDYWLRMVARLSRRSYEEMRVVVLEFLDTDIFHVSAENCVAFLDPLIESWDIDLATFGLEIVLNHSVVPGQAKRFEFVERDADQPVSEEPGLQEFLQDSSLSGTATPEEVAVGTAARLDRPGGRQPSAGAAPADGRPQAHLLARNDARKGDREVLSSPRAEPGGCVGLRT